MTLAWLATLVLAAAPGVGPPATAYSYRTPDGIVHYVGSEDDVPETYRQAARRIDLTGVPPGGDLAEGRRAATGPVAKAATEAPPVAAHDRDHGLSPRVDEILLACLLCLLPVLLFIWLRSPRKRLAVLALAMVDLGLGIYVGFPLRPGHSPGPVSGSPVRGNGQATRVRERLKTNQTVHRRQPQPILGQSTPAPGPAPAPQVPTAAPPEDPSAPGTPVRRVIKPSGAETESEDPEE
ncbi:MAG TPA: hypothetical protein VMB50_22480 [Myxococcales bacterium]|nr:hypothetical protein [Myxococcales bacterium]